MSVRTVVSGLLVMGALALSTSAFAQVHVQGYYKGNGTYVQPHQRTMPNGIPSDNYSYPGNYNPNTGQITPGTGLGTYSGPLPYQRLR